MSASKGTMKITVLGASGFIGRHLCTALRSRGDVVTTASLRDPAAAARACSGADVLVNLAGEPVAQRWSPRVKELIRSSRVDAPRALFAELAKLDAKPAAYVSASAIGYYGTSDSATFDETSTAGNGYLAEVCVAWEAQADRAAELGMRVAKIRTGLVLGTDGGALPKLLPIFKLGGGGNVASGKQWYSWIHIDDQVGIYLHAIDGTDGVLDATAPEPVRNAAFTSALAAAVHRPAFFPVPAFAIGLIFGEGAVVVTDGQCVLPTRTIATGYSFRYPTIDAALTALVG
ncbi:MAG: TIGR01777 family oxidoreductase [Vulcanimicrobiaceae bacterium]